MSALGRVVRAGVGRRRVQTVVMTLTTLISVAASVLAAGLLVASEAPFDHAFAAAHGAHLTAQFSGVPASRLAATSHASGVTASAGPFQTVTSSPTTDDGPVAGARLEALNMVGRASADGPVDHVTIIDGHWPTGPGQIVLSTQGNIGLPTGATLRFVDLPGRPTLTVVGTAQSVTDTADAWVTPAQAAALNPAGAAPSYEMLYRFAHAATSGQLATDRNAVTATLPHGSLTGTLNYLTAKEHSDETTKAFVPFVAAFGVLGLSLSVLIIVIVVSGAVSAGTRRIGILKSLGFTPAQVGRAYLGQALIPAVVGAAFGVLVGNLLAMPALHQVQVGYNSVHASIPLWVDVAVPLAALALVAAAALAPALRAGRLRTADAIAVGRTPNAARGRLVRRLTGRLPLPRPVSLGLASPFARPSRAATTTAAVALAAVAVTLGVGLAMSLNAVENGRELYSAGAVTVHAGGGPKGGGPVQPGGPAQPSAEPSAAKVAAAIKAQSGTRAYFGTTQLQLGISGIAGSSPVVAYQGDSSWATHQMIAGHWLTGPGQGVVTSRFLEAAGVHVGDTVTVTYQGRRTTVRIVGEAFFLSDQAMDLLTEGSSLTGLGLHPQSDQFQIDLKSGTQVAGYVSSLNSALQSVGGFAEANTQNRSDVIATMDALIGTLTLLLVAAAALGVLNTVVLDTRERVHDLGMYKALGMAPGQTVAMVLTSVATIGLVAGAIGVPVGVLVHDSVIKLMGDAIDVRVAPAEIGVYAIPVLIILAIAGLVIAIAGALLPAGWAAKTRTTTALRTE